MASYCHINNNYNDLDELDKMARDVNNKKKNKSKDIYKQYRKTQVSLENGVDAFVNLENNKLDRCIRATDKVQNDMGFFSAQGEYYSEYKPRDYSATLIKDIHKNKASNTNNNVEFTTFENYGEESQSSLESPSDDSNESDDKDSHHSSSNDSEFTSTLDTKDIKKEVISKSKYRNHANNGKKRSRCLDFDLASVDDLESLESGESLFDHVKNCRECKKKLIELIRKQKKSAKHLIHNVVEESTFPIKHTANKSESSNGGSGGGGGGGGGGPELKEIITICLIGFLVIIVLDLMIKGFR